MYRLCEADIAAGSDALALIDDLSKVLVSKSQSLQACSYLSCAGSYNLIVGYDELVVVAVKYERAVRCTCVEVDRAGLVRLSKGLLTGDREHSCQILNFALGVISVSEVDNRICICLLTAQSADLAVVLVSNVHHCVNSEAIAYVEGLSL